MLLGITPAYAGNTQTLICSYLYTEDHPRLRGEHFNLWNTLPVVTGSPPPTRGTLIFDIVRTFVRRITPAYAGNTIIMHYCLIYFRDHPRLRGEHPGSRICKRRLTGSPPPTRGTQVSNLKQDYNIGITPAYAGNTESMDSPERFKRSPPPTRGTRQFFGKLVSRF